MSLNLLTSFNIFCPLNRRQPRTVAYTDACLLLSGKQFPRQTRLIWFTSRTTRPSTGSLVYATCNFWAMTLWINYWSYISASREIRILFNTNQNEIFVTTACLVVDIKCQRNLLSMKFRFVFWDVLPCKIIVDRRCRGTCCLNHQSDHLPDDGGLWNVGRQLFYTAVHPRRQIWTLYSPLWELEISHILSN
jgi:hypothetical protein